mmetsp:Transcript_20435/g.31946  ORF Transcript_20435/g.31946 Transcript_20435/m.31946 type:complete len:187 (-) Transcript_20435:175-735(-)
MMRMCFDPASMQGGFSSLGWSNITETVLKNSGGRVPKPRHNTNMAVDSDGGMAYLFGGFGGYAINFDDLWQFNVDELSWQILSPTNEGPTMRGGTNLVSRQGRLALFGGARCSPVCKCFDDLWVYDLSSGQWIELKAKESKPPARYKHNTVWFGDSLWIFGGEGYRFSQDYHNDVWKVTVPSLPTE